MNTKDTEKNKTIFEKIKDAREAIGKTQDEVCAEIGISRNSYFLIEKGKTKNLSIDFGKKISKVLGVSFNELFEVENEKEEKLTTELARLNRELENCKKELENTKIERDGYREIKTMELKSLIVIEKTLLSTQKKLNESSAKLLLSESFYFLDNDLFSTKFPDLLSKKPLNKVFDFETIENFFYLFKSNIDEILNYIDLNKFRNDIRLNKLLSKFDLSINKSDLFNEIERFQASLRKELNL
jgi:transcriptional regulator with XRE-family HTH domain